MYLLNARTLMQLADAIEGDEKTKARIRFAVQQWIDASSPSNFLALNPEALQKALATKGQSLTTGMHQLLADLQKGHVSQTDESVFEVGRNVATAEGSVVFENEFFQLIEYRPSTEKCTNGRCCSCRRASTSTTSWTCSPRTRSSATRWSRGTAPS
jgi:polyhydroxyalkanoate synthase